MVPSWWRHRRMARDHTRRAEDRVRIAAAGSSAGELAVPHPPRDGL